MHATLNGGDAVGEGVDGLVIPGVPLQRDLDFLAVLGFLEGSDLAEEGLLRRVEVLDEVDDAAGVLEGRLEHGVGALVGEADLEALVQKGHDLQPFGDGLGAELDLVEDRRVRPEGDRGAVSGLARGAVVGGRPDGRDLLLDLPALLELTQPVLSVPVHLENDPAGQRVHHRDADPVEPPGHLVALTPELSAGVQGGHHDLRRRDLRVLRIRTYRDARAIIRDPTPAIAQKGDVNAVAPSRHRLVDGVVHHLPYEMVQTTGPGRPDVHPGPLPDCFQAF